MKKIAVAVIASLVSSLSFANIDEAIQTDYKINYESGFLGIQNHRIKLSKNNTYFDYVDDGGQQNLYSYTRGTLDIGRQGEFLVRFVYQPIDLVTTSTLEKDISIDNVIFEKGTAMEYRYSFPYYRATYFWSLIDTTNMSLYGGLGIQIRNATIEFASRNGSQQVVKRDVGPVPLFSLLLEYRFTDSTFLHYEAEGNYANTSYINGDDDSGVTGAIIDTAFKLHTKITDKIIGFSSFRYISGGARGTSKEIENATSDGYASNWIDAMAFSLGLQLNLDEFQR